MRIISGTHKGRMFHPPKNLKARPTTDYAKEGLFNVLANRFDFEQLSILDLFAGTGSLSYEFASRECKKIISIDKNFNHIKYIQNTARDFGFNQIRAIKSDVFRYVKSCKDKFDIIFADPPFELESIPDIPEYILSHNLLNDDGWLIVEHPKNVIFTGNKNLTDHKKYGNVNFSIFCK